MDTEEKLVTFAEYMKLPDPEERLVLHHGRVVKRPIHTWGECELKNHLVRLMDKLVDETAFTMMSIAYQPLPEYELWVAGVAMVALEHWNATALGDDDYLPGSPEVVMEILGPSITMDEIEDEREIAMRTGCRQFWIIDTETKTVHVTESSEVKIYSEDMSIPLPDPWKGTAVPVSNIFYR